jgi:hypothetical protein
MYQFIKPATPTTRRNDSPRIALPVQEMNVHAVRNFMLECLVPILAEEFLRRRDRADPNSDDRTFRPVGREAVL